MTDKDVYHQGWFDKLGKISPTFCLAKWKQVTLHLQTGHKHSCHHPNTHKIDIEAIKKDPSALHNTEFSMELRQQMLDGVRPPECGYCWKAEDTGSFSDRVYKSATRWAYPFFDEVVKKGSKENIFPSYLEVSFSNVCNFKCTYCAPNISSQWYQEVEQHGGFPLSFGVSGQDGNGWTYNDMAALKAQDKMPIPHNQENPYVEAFWKWWPELYRHLQTFRITGGEPLLTKDTFKVLDSIIEDPIPNKNLRLEINSNLCVPDQLFDNFVTKLDKLVTDRCTGPITIFTSCEAKGERAEYIRTGLDYDKHLRSLKTLLDMFCKHKMRPHHYKDPARYNHVAYMCTFNALSVSSFKGFLEDIVDIRSSLEFSDELLEHAQDICDHPENHLYETQERDNIRSLAGGQMYLATQANTLDIPFLRFPSHLSIDILTDDFGHYFEECHQFMKDSPWFSDFEARKMERVWNVYKNNKTGNETKRRLRKQFQQYVDQLDTRRNTKFLETFPEYTNFYDYCKDLPA